MTSTAANRSTAGATDERIAVTAPNNSGCGGAGCYRFQAPKSEDIAAIVKNYATGVVGTGATFSIHPIWGDGGAGATNDRGQKVKVTVTYQFQSMIPVVPIPAITINGESTLVINH